MQASLCLVDAFIILIFFIPFILCGTISSRSNFDQGLLVISYDAFRPEYLNRNVTPNLNKFRMEGISAPFMQNVFPTKTFVNHHSIATGFYPEHHGVTANELYDAKLGRLGYCYELFHYDENIVPIWTANEKAGKHSGCMMWPGSNFPYQNITCTFNMPFNGNVSWKERVDTVIQWFSHDETPTNLIMLYIEEPDLHAHVYGSESETITKLISKLDDLTEYIQQQLIEHRLNERINVIHLSDHGMNDVSPPHFIDLREFTTENSFKWYGSSPILQIVPNDPQKTNAIFANLTKASHENGHFKVYNSENIPLRWHVNNTNRMGPILAVAAMNYAFHDMIDTAKEYEQDFHIPFVNTSKYGVHGYDNAEQTMHAIFMANGPMFKKNQIIKPVDMINLYHLFCFILDIECYKTDGSNERKIWDELFSEEYSSSKSHQNLISQQTDESLMPKWMILIIMLLIMLIIGWIYMCRRRKRRHASLDGKSPPSSTTCDSLCEPFITNKSIEIIG